MKKSQAALEAFTTYGWVILLVAISLFGLKYFGILDADRYLPRKCIITAGISCLDMDYGNDKFVFLLKNNMGEGIEDVSLSVPNCPGWKYDGFIKPGEEFTAEILDCEIKGSRYEAKPLFAYNKAGIMLSHTITGELVEKINNGRGKAVVSNDYTSTSDCPPASALYCRIPSSQYYDYLADACFYDLEALGTPCPTGASGAAASRDRQTRPIAYTSTNPLSAPRRGNRSGSCWQKSTCTVWLTSHP